MVFYYLYETSQKSTLLGGLKRGPREKYNRSFPEGVQEEKIQQWRQARSRPGEKEETLNIMLRENANQHKQIQPNASKYVHTTETKQMQANLSKCKQITNTSKHEQL